MPRIQEQNNIRSTGLPSLVAKLVGQESRIRAPTARPVRAGDMSWYPLPAWLLVQQCQETVICYCTVQYSVRMIQAYP